MTTTADAHAVDERRSRIRSAVRCRESSIPTTTTPNRSAAQISEVDQRRVDARAEPGDGVRQHHELGSLDVDGLLRGARPCAEMRGSGSRRASREFPGPLTWNSEDP